MRSLSSVLLAALLLTPQVAAAQSEAAAVSDSGAVSAPAPKKKGLFGKVKGLAKNKIVKSVAKVALCTAVPGGQVIAGALDAAKTKNVGAAAATAAGGGGGCMPGMPGAAAAAGAGAAGLGAAGAVGALSGGVPTAELPGQPSAAMPAMTMSPEQLKQMQEQYGKMGMDTAQLRAMQQMMSGMPGGAPAGAAANAAPPEPASGAPALSREKGRILVRGLPWLADSETLQQGGDPMFGMAMREVATAIQGTGKRYKIEARVEEQGGKKQNRSLAQKRAAAVLAALAARGVAAERLTVADGKSDKDPRIIVSEGK
jgi:OmpA family